MKLNLDKIVSAVTGRNPLLTEEETLCLYPSINVMMTANGKYKPCCKWVDTLHNEGEELQAPRHTIEDAWKSSELVDLREQLKAGKKPDKCSVCWKEEESGIRSMRYDSFSYRPSKESVANPKAPIRLDIYPSNICNLKCRICSPEYSTRWIAEAKETQGIEEETHLNLNKDNLDILKDWLPNVVEIGLFGGEPLFMKETLMLMEYCVEYGFSKNITLLINTNGTIYSDNLMKVFMAFKRVLINFSIDDCGQRFEYQRSGAIWETTVQNIKSYVDNKANYGNHSIEYKMCCTVSALNVFYLPEYLSWVSATFPGMSVYLNFLHGPYSLAMRNLPTKVKQRIAEKLSSTESALKVEFEEGVTRTWDNVLNMLNAPAEQPSELFFNELERGDTYRKESFQNVFPEYWELLQPFNPNAEATD
ncbi:MAG: twitch domain-containing radical SAM protein [Flavobacteriales bacterium]|nr:twitch domain-containing radical SAM protein [Flavobacteriales bacterium]